MQALSVTQGLSTNTVPAQMDQELISSKARTGLRNVMYYFKHKIGLTPFCFSYPVTLSCFMCVVFDGFQCLGRYSV
jgi:tetrahydromethanopterin S-methyltransferase subunit E